MATISTSGIEAGRIIRSAHVLRIIEALDGEANNDIIISGSLITTGSVGITGSLDIVGNVTGSEFTGSFTGDGSNLTGVTGEWDGTHDGNANITGSFNVSGSTGLTGSLDVSGSVVLSGSFSGSYEGDGTNLTGITAEWDGTRDGNADITGSFNVSGSTGLTGSLEVSGSVVLSGSFSGSFEGDGSALTGLPSTNSGSFSGSFEGDGSALTGITGEWDGTRDGDAEITGSFNVSGSTGITGSLVEQIHPQQKNRVQTSIATTSTTVDYIKLNNVARLDGSNDPMSKFQIGIKELSTTPSTAAYSMVNFYSSASNDFGAGVGTIFKQEDRDMSLISGSKIELYRDTEITGSLTITDGITVGNGTSSFIGQLSTTGSIVTFGAHGASAPNYVIQHGGYNRVQNKIDDSSGLGDNFAQLINVARMGGAYGADATHKFQIEIEDADQRVDPHCIASIYTSASFDNPFNNDMSFKSADRDMSFISGSKIEMYRDTDVTGSLGITEVLSLAPIDPLPTDKPTGSFATSGSAGSVKPFFWDGTNWNALY